MTSRPPAALALALLAPGLSLVWGGACTDIPFICSSNAQCVRGGEQGFCEDNRRCSFPDDGCPSQRRYAPFGTGEDCVPPLPPCALSGVASGANFSCAWSNRGRVSCWGDNGLGQLGDGTTVARATAKRIEPLVRVSEVVAGPNHACAQHDDGSVSCWGDNSASQLGDGTTINRPAPVRVAMLAMVGGLAAGGRHTCARRRDGSLACWGRNDHGQVGDGTMMNRGVATAVAPGGGGALFQQVTAGDAHTCALAGAPPPAGGGMPNPGASVVCWGWNRMGVLGPRPEPMLPAPSAPLATVPPATQVVAGDIHTCALAASGEVLCWGANDLGQAGDRALGRMVEPTRVPGVSGVAELDAGAQHTCALGRDGSVRCWGNAAAGQLGPLAVDTGAPAAVPPPATATGWTRVAAGARHSCGLSAAGEVLCWGRSSEGQLGDGTVLQLNAPAAVVMLGGVAAVATGGAHSCALSRAGRVLCWGRGDAGQLGNGQTASESRPVAVNLPAAIAAVQVVAGNEFACARLADGAVHCWGRGTRGQIGDGTSTDHPTPAAVMLDRADPVVNIAAGTEHACAVTTSGAVFCWGEAGGGRLGNSAMPAAVQNRPIPVVLPAPFNLIAAGIAHTCAVARTGGGVTCWGTSSAGQAGVAGATTPVPPTAVAGITDVTAIAAGGDHTCALTSDGTVWCWGRGDQGQLGFGTSSGLPQPVALQRFGPVISLAAGTSHSCAILRDGGAAHCWGAGRYGQLGTGMTANTTRPTPVMGGTGLATVDAGDRHSCAVGTDGTVRCWGSAQYGQIGNGVPLVRPTPVKVGGIECP